MVLKPIKDVLVGTLVGIVSMLPGASGATIAVIFGIYERLVADLADIRHRFFSDLRFILLIGVGILMGMFVCAFGLDFLIDNFEIPTMFFFAALIVSQIPDIRRLGGDGKPVTGRNMLAFAVGFAVMIAFIFIGDGEDMELSGISGTVIMVLVGIILAISKLAPGVSGSTVLLALGLFTPFMHALTEFDMGVLIPVGVGLVIGVLGFSKIIDHYMRVSRKSTYSMILGLTAGSIVTVTVQAAVQVSGTDMIVTSAIGIVLGLVIGLGLSKIAFRYAKETVPQE